MPKVGIVIPVYKGGPYLQEALQGLQTQAMRDWVAVVVDDGSPEDVDALVAPFVGDPRIRLVHQVNQGVCSARNAGYALLPEGIEFVMFHDQDDILASSALDRLVNELTRHPEAGLVHCQPLLIDADGTTRSAQGWMPRWAPTGRGWARELPSHETGETPLASIYTECGITPSLSLFRCAALPSSRRVFDPELGQICEDTNVAIGVALRWSVRHLAEPLVRYRLHSSQISALDRGRHATQRARLYAKWSRASGLTHIESQRLRAAERFRTGALELRLSLIAGKLALRTTDVPGCFRAFDRLCRSIMRILANSSQP